MGIAQVIARGAAAARIAGREGAEAAADTVAREADEAAAEAAAAAKEAKAAARRARRASSPSLAVDAPAIVRRVSGANRRAAGRSPQFDRGELAVRYPETQEPVLAIDKTSGKPFLEKSYTEEEVALQAERNRVQREMDREGYTPVFDPEGRFYVDPSNYRLKGNTLELTPVRADTIAKKEALARSEGALSRLSGAFERMQDNPGARDWYAVGQLEKAYIDTFGPEAGREAFRRRFAEGMAATTGGMDPKANLLASQYGGFLDRQGVVLPTEKGRTPHPVGGRYLGTNLDSFNRLFGGGEELLAENNPKRFNFAANFMGDLDRVTLDEQMSGLIVPGMTMPDTAHYGTFELPLHELARQYGVGPANFQDVAWAGGKILKTPKYRPAPMISTVNEAIERTARVLGIEPDDVLEMAIMRNMMPTYAEGGPVSRVLTP